MAQRGSGRFDTQADVMRFLQRNPAFPRDGSGIVRNMRVTQILTQYAYAGFVEAPSWGVPMRQGHHEPIISVETIQRIQDRLNGINRAPYRKNLDGEFPLRGYVVCDHCETPLTACWSKGHSKHYPYYFCPKRGCEAYGKSIKRDKIEGEFETLLRSFQTTEKLFSVVKSMFSDLWGRRLEQAESQRKALKTKLISIDLEVG